MQKFDQNIGFVRKTPIFSLKISENRWKIVITTSTPELVNWRFEFLRCGNPPKETIARWQCSIQLTGRLIVPDKMDDE
jgi:hypothetical protein